MPEIVVTVGKDGSTVVSVNGVAGPGCKDLSRAIETALGVASEACDLTSEYYQEATSEEQKAGQG